MEVPSPTVYKLWRRDAGGERACVRGVGRARTALLLLLFVLRAMLAWDRRGLREVEEQRMGGARWRKWKDEGGMVGAI